MDRLRDSGPWQVFAVLPRADRGLAALRWTVLGLRAVLPHSIRAGGPCSELYAIQQQAHQ